LAPSPTEKNTALNQFALIQVKKVPIAELPDDFGKLIADEINVAR
jgi:hypothetical protein